jgi:hypothetical protein
MTFPNTWLNDMFDHQMASHAPRKGQGRHPHANNFFEQKNYFSNLKIL